MCQSVCPQCNKIKFFVLFADNGLCLECQLKNNCKMNEYPLPDFLDLLNSELRIRRLKAEYTERLKHIQHETARLKEEKNRLLNISSQAKKTIRLKYTHCKRSGCNTKLRSPNYYGMCSCCKVKSGRCHILR